MIKRALFKDLKAHLSAPEISLIVGPRQAGKTTLMRLLEEELKNQGKQTLFLNLDLETEREYFKSQTSLLRKIRLEFGQAKGYVFIDEIQRKKNAGLFLKGLYDAKLPYKFIVSGSGSLELKENIHESLTGRKRIFALGTLTFQEFLNYKTAYKYEGRESEFFAVEKTQAREWLEEYLNFGGYPRVVLETQLDEKIKLINEIYQSYLEKDIGYLLGVKKTEDFTRLVRILAVQAGNLVNVSELSSTLGLSAKTVQNFLWYLEKTFVLCRLSPYFKNARKEITKAPKVYFYDLGMRNYAAGEFGELRPDSAGIAFENFIHLVLKEKLLWTGAELHFWRTKDGAEVDFMVSKGGKIRAIEVKYSFLKKPDLSRSLRNFISNYKPDEVFVVNLSLNQGQKIDRTEVRFLTFAEFMQAKIF